MSAEITVALIAAGPPTLAAIAAFYAVNKNTKQLTPSNGHTVAHMIEDLWQELTDAQVDIDTAEDDRESLRQQIHDHDQRLQDLSDDVQSHWRTGICPECEAIIRVDPNDIDGTPI